MTEKKKYKLRHHFSIEQKGEVVVGPIEVELDDKEAHDNRHKLEPVSAEQKPKGAKQEK